MMEYMCVNTPPTPAAGSGLGQAAPAATGRGPHGAVSHSGASGEPAVLAALGRDQPQR